MKQCRNEDAYDNCATRMVFGTMQKRVDVTICASREPSHKTNGFVLWTCIGKHKSIWFFSRQLRASRMKTKSRSDRWNGPTSLVVFVQEDNMPKSRMVQNMWFLLRLLRKDCMLGVGSVTTLTCLSQLTSRRRKLHASSKRKWRERKTAEDLCRSATKGAGIFHCRQYFWSKVIKWLRHADGTAKFWRLSARAWFNFKVCRIIGFALNLIKSSLRSPGSYISRRQEHTAKTESQFELTGPTIALMYPRTPPKQYRFMALALKRASCYDPSADDYWLSNCKWLKPHAASQTTHGK